MVLLTEKLIQMTLFKINITACMAVVSFLLLFACSEETPIPKPPTYLRLNFPNHEYVLFKEDACPYQFEASKLFKVNSVKYGEKTTCHKDIDLGALNGVIHFSYIDMVEPLSTYVNYANDKVDDHKLKASNIEDVQFIDKNKKVYGTFFELQGNVATPFQFYLTDSVSRFVRGEVLLNSIPNYDSLKPTLDYLKVDLEHMIETFKWK